MAVVVGEVCHAHQRWRGKEKHEFLRAICMVASVAGFYKPFLEENLIIGAAGSPRLWTANNSNGLSSGFPACPRNFCM